MAALAVPVEAEELGIDDVKVIVRGDGSVDVYFSETAEKSKDRLLLVQKRAIAGMLLTLARSQRAKADAA